MGGSHASISVTLGARRSRAAGLFPFFSPLLLRGSLRRRCRLGALRWDFRSQGQSGERLRTLEWVFRGQIIQLD